MDTSTDPGGVIAAARRHLEADSERRMDAVRAIVDAARSAHEAEVALRAALAARAGAWTAALDAGWREEDLARFGLHSPDGSPAESAGSGRRRSYSQPETPARVDRSVDRTQPSGVPVHPRGPARPDSDPGATEPFSGDSGVQPDYAVQPGRRPALVG